MKMVLWWTAFAVIYAFAVQVDLHETIDRYFEAHYPVQGDELLTAFTIIGLLGLVYSLIRVKDLSREIRRRVQAEKLSAWAATHDALTMLPNRRELAARLEEARSGKSDGPLAVFAIDLDGFKKVNDLLGHEGGDAVLRIAAERLTRFCKGECVFRLGGDEFLAIIRRTDNVDPVALGEQIVAEMAAPMDGGGVMVELGASVGIAFYPEHDAALETVINYADCALYEAKKAGKNRIELFSPAFEEALTKRTLLESALRKALKRGAVVPYFQPLVDLSTGRIVGFEALARWENTAGNFVPPSDFIPVAEDTGLIVELTEQLFRAAVAEAVTWPSDVTLSFNLSPVQLGDRMLPLRIMKTLGEFGLPPQRLELEITETALMKDTATTYSMLSQLMEAGIGFALDDFGTGYSSLSHLAVYEFDKIKIDRSFVVSLSENDRQDKVVRTIIALGKSLGIKTTAEGIENLWQLDHLRELGCDIGQGYLFGKAVRADQVAALLSAQPAGGERRSA